MLYNYLGAAGKLRMQKNWSVPHPPLIKWFSKLHLLATFLLYKQLLFFFFTLFNDANCVILTVNSDENVETENAPIVHFSKLKKKSLEFFMTCFRYYYPLHHICIYITFCFLFAIVAFSRQSFIS